MLFRLAFSATALFIAATAQNSGCELIGRKNCKPADSVGALIGCVWSQLANKCLDPDTGSGDTNGRASTKCGNLDDKPNRCNAADGCVYVNGQCHEGRCKLARDYPFDCKAAPHCAFQMPHGNKIWQDYHPKVRNECLEITERLGHTDYAKIDINHFCTENKKRRDCLRPRYVAYPERLRFQLETDICFWNYNQEVCRVNREGAQYGNVVNATDTALPQEDPDYVIVRTSEPPKNKLFSRTRSNIGNKDMLMDDYDEYNKMCLDLSESNHTIGDGCEEHGCALFFDESKFNRTSRLITEDAVYCVPRYPATAAFGVDPNLKFQSFANGGDTGERFDFLAYTDPVIKEWINYLLCDFVAPEYCNSIRGCNPKKDIASKANGVTSYICTGEPDISGKRRRIEGLTDAELDELEAEDEADGTAEDEVLPEGLPEKVYDVLLAGAVVPDDVDVIPDDEMTVEDLEALLHSTDPAGVTDM